MPRPTTVVLLPVRMFDGSWRWFHDSEHPNRELIYELRFEGGMVNAYNDIGEPLGPVQDFAPEDAVKLVKDPAAYSYMHLEPQGIFLIRFDRNVYFRKWEVPYGVR